MRESSHCVVANNRACVVISSQLYDRRAIDSPLPTLPLVTSLQHLAYLTSTSPRIREILTLDGGLERLITIVGGCLDQAFPHSKAQNTKKRDPTSAPQKVESKLRKRRIIPFKPFHAYSNGSDGQDYVNLPGLLHTYGFALQCLVNVGVRGSEAIRTRVVDAGVLHVVSRILSAFLSNRRKQLELELAEQGLKTPDQHEQSSDDGHTPRDPTPVMITTAPTPLASRHALTEFETLIAPTLNQTTSEQQQQVALLQATIPAIRRTNTPDTLASNDAETDMQSEQDFNENEAESSGQENDRSTHMNRRRTRSSTLRHAAAPRLHNLSVSGRSHSAQSSRTTRRRHQQNNASHRSSATEEEEDEDVQSPRSGSAVSPMETSQHDSMQSAAVQSAVDDDGDVIMSTRRQSLAGESLADQNPTSSPLQIDTTLTGNPPSTPLSRLSPLDPLPFDHHFKEDDVLHCLHLLAYLSKYPHVRAIFHDPHGEAPPSLPPIPSTSHHHTSSTCSRKKQKCGDNGQACQAACTHDHAHEGDEDEECEHECGESSECRLHKWSKFVRAQTGNDSDDDAELAQAKAMASLPAKDRKPALEPSRPPKSTANNVFSLVEQFTYRTSTDAPSSRRDSGHLIVKLPPDIQYWAGVIMRNACRKDEQRGGIRQCANMSCGVWERFPREFAKCRRCRKAKYCSKQCQRKAWQAGHRYWCSARQDTVPQQANLPNPSPPPSDNIPLPMQIATNTAMPEVIDDDSTTEIRVVDGL